MCLHTGLGRVLVDSCQQLCTVCRCKSLQSSDMKPDLVSKYFLVNAVTCAYPGTSNVTSPLLMGQCDLPPLPPPPRCPSVAPKYMLALPFNHIPGCQQRISIDACLSANCASLEICVMPTLRLVCIPQILICAAFHRQGHLCACFQRLGVDLRVEALQCWQRTWSREGGSMQLSKLAPSVSSLSCIKQQCKWVSYVAVTCSATGATQKDQVFDNPSLPAKNGRMSAVVSNKTS